MGAASTLKSDLLLLLTAVIWGFAFTAQRLGMDYIGPFTYSAIRFALGTAVLLPFALRSCSSGSFVPVPGPPGLRVYFLGGGLAGLALFGGVSFQQVGLVYTTAGNAGFITGLYVVLVPIMGLLWRQSTTIGTWAGAALAAIGLYLLSITEAMTISRGDLLVLWGALIWALHVHVLGYSAPRSDPLMLATVQFSVCTLLSWLAAVWFETIRWADVAAAAWPILYGGVMSVGIAYTLQVVAQRNAAPAHAAILLSLEAVFAAVGGWLILGEWMSLRARVGCALMLSGMLVSQLSAVFKRKKPLAGS
jgi:drug/metabolite transporter (DMT)-like permease